jgi:hypothetical protein
VRILNLSDKPVGGAWDNRPIDAEVAPGAYHRFRMVPSGDQEVVLKSGGQVVGTVPIKVEEEKLYTIVAYGSGSGIKYALVTGEEYYPTASSNLQVFVLDESGKKAKGEVTLTTGSNKYVLSDSSGGQLVSAGSYTIQGNNLDMALGGNVQADHSYSLLVLKRADGSQSAVLLENTVIEEPVAGGAS